MKRIIVILTVFIFFTGTAFARLNPSGKNMVGVNGDYGFTIAGVSNPTFNKGYDSYIGKTYGAGFKVGYGLFKSSIIYTGLELQQRELVVKYSYGSDSWKERYSQQYLDIPVAYRLLFSSMYADFGGYYGVRIGSMRYKITSEDPESGAVNKKYTKNDYGLLLGIGGIIQVDENSGIDIGVKIKYGFPWVIDAPGFKISSVSANLTVGYITVF